MVPAAAVCPAASMPAVVPVDPPAPPPAPACPTSPAASARLARAERAPLPADTSAATSPVVSAPPIALSAEHAKMLTTPESQPTLPELHARLLVEAKDPSWAAGTEDMIRRDLAAANETGEFDIPTIECRETLCEVLAFGNAPNSPLKWSRAMGELRKQWEAAGLVNHSSSITGANGRFVIVSILERRRKP